MRLPLTPAPSQRAVLPLTRRPLPDRRLRGSADSSERPVGTFWRVPGRSARPRPAFVTWRRPPPRLSAQGFLPGAFPLGSLSVSIQPSEGSAGSSSCLFFPLICVDPARRQRPLASSTEQVSAGEERKGIWERPLFSLLPWAGRGLCPPPARLWEGKMRACLCVVCLPTAWGRGVRGGPRQAVRRQVPGLGLLGCGWISPPVAGAGGTSGPLADIQRGRRSEAVAQS